MRVAVCCSDVCGTEFSVVLVTKKSRVIQCSANINWTQGLCWHSDLCATLAVSVCFCVCMWASSGQLACSLCWKQMRGVSESFILWDLYCWKLGISQKPGRSFPPFLSLYSSQSFCQLHLNRGINIHPFLLRFVTRGQHSQHISVTSEHHKSRPKLAVLHYFLPSFAEIKLDKRRLGALSDFQEPVKQEVIGNPFSQKHASFKTF